MRLSRGLLLLATGLPGLIFAACSASNGDAIPSEVRDAEALDMGSTIPPAKDSGSPSEEDAGTTKDATTKDAPADAPLDAPSSATVRINEVYVDRVLGGDKTEYVELRGAEGTPVDDLFLRVIDRNGNVDLDIAAGNAGQKIGATGTWVIATDSLLTRVDRSVPLNVWGLDSSGAVQLTRGAGKTLIDVVGWTDDADGGSVPEPSTNPKATSEGKPVVVPSGVTSFGRAASGADTNDNRADFCIMAKSPGAQNGACQ